jgi:threonine synthase
MDGGLFVPSFSLPKIRIERLLEENSYTEKALRILEPFIGKHFSPQDLRLILGKAYCPENFSCDEIVSLQKLEKNRFLLELFHGPTASFKDIALQLTPKFFSYVSDLLESEKQNTLILTATSGDTGSAAMEGFRHEPNISMLTIFPENGVSKIQEAQMISLDGGKVRALAVKADFDVCQSAVKQIFQDEKVRKQFLKQYNTRLSAANSINWGRLLPQVVYFVTAYLQLVQKGECKIGEEIDICVPTGNFGNILSALYAKKMGIPIKKLLCASNENSVLTDFLTTGIYDLRERKLKKTISPSIDILKSSNLERLLYLLSDGDTDFVRLCYEKLDKNSFFEVPSKILQEMQELFFAGFASEQETLITIRKVFEETSILIDPHTAVAKKVGDQYNGKSPMIIAATAHFGKFLPTVLSAFGETVEENNLSSHFILLKKIAPNVQMHPRLLPFFLKDLPVLQHVISGDLEAIVGEAEKVVEKICPPSKMIHRN